MAEVLAAEGYETIGFSNNPWISEESGLQQGFATFHEAWRVSREPVFDDDGAELTNEMVLRWLGERSAPQPFFAFVHYMEPHLGYNPPAEAARPFLDGFNPEVVERLRAWRHPREVGYILGVPGLEVSEQEFEALRALYDGELAYLDRRIGELIGALDERGSGKDTVVVVTSDHGEHFGEHDLMDHKMSLYDALLKVPLIVRYPPAVPAGVRLASQVQTNDLFVSILKWCGVSSSPPRGARLLPLDPSDPGRELTYAEFSRPTRFLSVMADRFPGADQTRFDRSLVAVRGRIWKYIWASDGTRELYDLAADPRETTDLRSREPDRANEMQGELIAFRR